MQPTCETPTGGLTMADVYALQAAIASGALKVKYRDQEVTYANFDELQKRYDFVLGKVAAANGGAGRVRSERRTAVYDGGRGDCGGGGSRNWIPHA